MHPKLQALFSEIETQRQHLQVSLGHVVPAQFNAAPQPGKWSMSEVVSHVVTSEKLSLGYMEKKINAIGSVGTTNVLNEFMLGVFIASQRLPLKYKAPKSIGNKPNAYTSVDVFFSDWQQSRQRLAVFLEAFPAHGLHKKIYRHPVMGRCSVLHCLAFFREHFNHHLPQITRQLR